MKTLSQLMTEALTQAGLDVGSFSTLARGWMNTILESQCRNFDWPWYAKTWADQPFVAGQTIYTPLPTDFARPDQNIYLVQNNQKSSLIKMVDRGLFETLRQQTAQGMPTVSTIEWDYTAGNLVPSLIFDAVPISISGAQPFYFRMPYFRVATPVATDGTDDSKIPDFINQDFLLDQLKKMAFEHQDDERFGSYEQKTDKVLRENKFQANMAKTSKINLAPEIYPPGYRGPGSNNGGNGWMGP